MQKDPNTLFLIANWGLHEIEEGVYESHMWLLDEDECMMEYVSLHESKNSTAYLWGEIIDTRPATGKEIAAHQEWLRNNGKKKMVRAAERMIVEFRLLELRELGWPDRDDLDSWQYKSTGYVEVESSD